MNAVITGSSGFVGSNLTSFLQGFNIEVLHLTRAELNSGIFDRLEEVQAIVHLAGKAHDLRKSLDANEYYLVNYELTKKLYLAFLTSKASKFIFISSVKASADTVLNELSESDEPNPRTDYGKSKLMAEEFILSQVLPKGKSCYILRPCMIHGPGNKGNLNLLYNVVSRGIPYPLAAFDNRRSFLSIENLCFVIGELLKPNHIASGIYNVADDEVLSTNELIRLIGDVSCKPPLLWHVSPVLIKGLAKLGDILNLPLTTDRLIKLSESYVVNNSKIKQAMGKELPVSARDGLVETIKSLHKVVCQG